jgi:hypothetical protein
MVEIELADSALRGIVCVADVGLESNLETEEE